MLRLHRLMLNDQSRKKATIDTTSHIVPRENRNKGSVVIIETYRIVKSSSFGGVFAKTHYAFGIVVEPPMQDPAGDTDSVRQVGQVRGYKSIHKA
jgi:hypothetical protein